MKKPATPHGYWLFVGGDGGIRTHVPLRTTAFRVRLVMTTSIRLHIIRLACILRDFRKHKLNYTTNFAHLQAKFLIIVIITLLYSFPNYYRHLPPGYFVAFSCIANRRFLAVCYIFFTIASSLPSLFYYSSISTVTGSAISTGPSI